MEAYLRTEAHIKAVDSATDFTYRWCLNMNMEEEEAARFALAVDELLTNMILFAYRDRTGTIEIRYKYSNPHIEIIIRESGEPFDPDRYRYSRKNALEKGDFEGAGLELVRNLTDQFLFLNRGKEGKEFRLVKLLSEQSIADLQNPAEEAVEEKSDEHNYELVQVSSNDAEEVAKLIYRSYDYSYSKEDLYFPKQNELAIEHGRKFGIISRTEKGHPVGYFTVIKMSDSQVGEVGEAVVSPPHRNRGVMTRMLNKLVVMSRKKGLWGLYGMALTVHTISQKVNNSFGFKSTAMMIAESAGSKYRGIVENYPQPVTLIADFLPLIDIWKPSGILPARYKSILKKLYRQFEPDTNFGTTQDAEPAEHAETDLDLSLSYRNNTAQITVKELGKSFIQPAQSIMRSLNEIDLNSIYIDIPLDNPGNDAAVEWLHDNGFILSGLMPMIHREKDYLRMQKIMVPINFELIETYTETANHLKEFIMKEYHEL